MRYLAICVLNIFCLSAMTAPKFAEYNYNQDASWRETSQDAAIKAAGYDYLDMAYQNAQYVLHSFPCIEYGLSKHGVVVHNRAGRDKQYDLFFVGAVTYPQDVRYNPQDETLEKLSGLTQYGNFVIGYDEAKKRVTHRYFNWYKNKRVLMEYLESRGDGDKIKKVADQFLDNLSDSQVLALCDAISCCHQRMKSGPRAATTYRIAGKHEKIPVIDCNGLIRIVDRGRTGATYTILKSPEIYD